MGEEEEIEVKGGPAKKAPYRTSLAKAAKASAKIKAPRGDNQYVTAKKS